MMERVGAHTESELSLFYESPGSHVRLMKTTRVKSKFIFTITSNTDTFYTGCGTSIECPLSISIL